MLRACTYYNLLTYRDSRRNSSRIKVPKTSVLPIVFGVAVNLVEVMFLCKGTNMLLMSIMQLQEQQGKRSLASNEKADA